MAISEISAYGDNGDNPDNDNSGINLAKGMAMGIMFLTSFTLGILPMKLYKWFNGKSNSRNNVYVKMLLGFGGGVLLCTTFLHLLPEVAEDFEAFNLTPNINIHYAEFLMCIGFFTMYFTEEFVHLYLHHRQNNSHDVLKRSLSIRRGEAKDTNELDKEQKSIPDYNTMVNQRHQESGEIHADHSHIILDASDKSTVAIIRGLFVVLALAVHELFEGLSIGLENSTKHVWYMFGAVSAHKLVIGFCIGMEFVSSGLKTSIIIGYIFIFAIVSPIGIGIGLLLTNEEESPTTLASVFLQGLASGTLLYVVFFEILQSDKKHGLKQCCSIFCGFLIMFGLTLIDA